MLLPTLLKDTLINQSHSRISSLQIKKIQLKKFRNLVSYAAKYSQYYQDIIDKNNIDIVNCKPEDFPILTKQILIEKFDSIVTDKKITKKRLESFLQQSQNPQDLYLNKYYVIHTSGTSGVIALFVYTRSELIQGISVSSRASVFKLGQKLAFIGAYGHFAGPTMITTAQKLPFLYNSVRIFDINKPLGEHIKELNSMQPTIVVGYAFALKKLAEAQNDGLLFIHPRILQSGGESLSTEDKLYIQKAFNAPVVNVYASSECLIMGISRDSFQGMYLMEDNVYFEFKQNQMYITNLYNRTVPIIRYQMSDHLKLKDDTNPLMPFIKTHDLVGRKELSPTFINDDGVEDFISQALIVEFFVPHLAQFQIELLDKKCFVFKACLEKGLDKKTVEKTKQAITDRLHRILKEKNMTKVKFSIKIVDQLWVDPKTGKFRLIVTK